MIFFKQLLEMIIASMIFFPQKEFYGLPADYRLQSEDVFLRTTDNVTLHGWYLKAPEEKAVILFFHGNAGNISNRLVKARGWIERGVSVFLVDYRGYGKSGGRIRHENDVYEDARTAFDWLRDKKEIPVNKIVLYGESLGTAPAVKLAAEYPVKCLILESPFTSFFDLGAIHYPFVPAAAVKSFAFSNVDRIGDVKAPVFILYGTHDEICPFQMGEKLFRLAPGPKDFFSVPGGSHNDLSSVGGTDYWERPFRFMAARQGMDSDPGRQPGRRLQ